MKHRPSSRNLLAAIDGGTTRPWVVLLLASLAGNAVLAYFLVTDRGPALAGAPTTRPAAPPDCSACEARLTACMDRPATTAPPRPLPVPFSAPTAPAPALEQTTKPAPRPASPGSMLAAVDAETQADMLCEVAKRMAVEEWARKKDDVTRGLRKTLPDGEEQERNVRHCARKAADLLGLSDADCERFEEHYREARLARMARAEELVRREPPDYAAILEEARGLFADEDRIAGELFGSAARERLRTAELEGRTTILALICALAGLPPEQALGW